MERYDQEKGPTFMWRDCSARSIHDLLIDGPEIAKVIKEEDRQWFKNVSIQEKIGISLYKIPLVLSGSYPFKSYLAPTLKKPYPTIEISPQIQIDLPPVTYIPDKKSQSILLQDSTGSVLVNKPPEVLKPIIKAGYNLNIEGLLSSSWTSRVVLLGVYNPNRYYLMHVFNDLANEKVPEATPSFNSQSVRVNY